MTNRTVVPTEPKPLAPSPELIEACKVWIESFHASLWAHFNVTEGSSRHGLTNAAEWLAIQICGVIFTDSTPVQTSVFTSDAIKAIRTDPVVVLPRATPTRFGKCNCMCHVNGNVSHLKPCCGPSS